MATWTRALDGQYLLRLTVNQGTQSMPENRTSVAVSLTIEKLSGSGYWSYNLSNWSANIGGYQFSGSFKYDFRNYGVLTLLNTSIDIYHDNNGQKSISCYGYASLDGIGTGDILQTLTLTTIPRQATITGANDFNDEQNGYVTFSNPLGNIAEELAIGLYWDYQTVLAPYRILSDRTVTSYTITLTSDERTALRKRMKDVNEMSVLYYVRTKINGNYYHSFVEKKITITGGLPVIGNITHSENVTLVKNVVGAYVKTVSKLNLAIMGAEGGKEATIKTYKLEVDGKTINAVSGTTEPIMTAGTLPIKATVTNSRGKTTTKTVNITVLDYEYPKFIESVKVVRSADDGTVLDLGTAFKATFKAAAKTLLVGGTQKNKLSYDISVREFETGNFTKITANCDTSAGIEKTAIQVIKAMSYSVDKSWEVSIDIYDVLFKTSVVAVISQGGVTVQFGKNWVSIGRLYDGKGTLSVGGDIYQNGKKVCDVDMVYPVGSIYISTADNNPQTFFGGTWVSFGAGRTLFGRDSTQNEFAEFRTGGAKTHTLTAAEMNHRHRQWLNFKITDYATGNGVKYQEGETTPPNSLETYDVEQSGAIAHNNLPPYITVYFFRRIA